MASCQLHAACKPNEFQSISSYWLPLPELGLPLSRWARRTWLTWWSFWTWLTILPILAVWAWWACWALHWCWCWARCWWRTRWRTWSSRFSVLSWWSFRSCIPRWSWRSWYGGRLLANERHILACNSRIIFASVNAFPFTRCMIVSAALGHTFAVHLLVSVTQCFCTFLTTRLIKNSLRTCRTCIAVLVTWYIITRSRGR
mmetsp:Transcript_141628/g.271920  ORF Transcript_141628/g.271920 Transcript_141628/m.271920 type:complete len:200 (-) Transcript_141628:1150-1749(-)